MNKVLKISKSTIVFYFLFIIGIIITISSLYIFPERFFFDAKTILGRGGWSFEPGLRGSYQFSILFYKVTGLKHLPYPVIGLIQYSTLCFIFYKIGVSKDLHKITIKNLIVYIMFLFLALYVSVPSKEFINFTYLSLVVFFIKNRKLTFKRTLILTLFLVIFLGYFFRPYYIIVAIITLFMYALSYVKVKSFKVATFFYGLALLIGMSLSYGIVKGQYISNSTRSAMVVYGNSNSAIVPPLDTSSWYGEATSIIHGFFSVNLPVNGFKFFNSPQIIFFVIWQLILFYLLILRYDRCIKEGKRKNYDLWLFYILFSYFIVQGVFEPDLGSALRHKASVFPIIYYLLNYEEFRRKK